MRQTKSDEELYYNCLARIDDDIEIGDFFLIGCIREARKRLTNVDTDRVCIKNNLENFNIYMYRREMSFICNLSDNSLSSLIASSLDLSSIYDTIKIIYNKIENANYDEVTATVHATKAVESAKILNKIAEKMKRVRRHNDNNLFKET